jgi:hypothetical protein
MEAATGGLAPSQREADLRRRPTSAASAPGKMRSRWPEWLALSAYSALVAFAIPFHEPFADEAQGWQLARSLSLATLFKTYIRYEGAPGLWHFLLWILVRAHVSYTGLHWISGAIAVAATALLLFKSPFPLYLKLAFPFTVFLVYQYAVVARNYVLAPILLYAIALFWKRSPLILALLLGLLANVALHASVISGGLAIVYLVEQVRRGDAKNPRRLRQLLLGAGILLALWAFAIWTAWPPHDFSNHLSACLRTSPLLILRGTLGSIVLGMFYPWILSVAFWIAIVSCLRARHSLLYLLPVLFFAIFAGIAGLTWWHVGLLIPLTICLFWITWPAPAVKISQPEIYGRTALVAMAIMQILWSGYAIEFDHYNAFSPDRATAEFLRPYVSRGASIAFSAFSSWYSISVLMAQMIVFGGNAVDDVLNGGHGGQHRVVLVVVFVHAVAAHQEQVLEAVDVVANHIEAVVAAEVSGIGLGHAHHMGILDVFRFEDPDLRDLLDGKAWPSPRRTASTKDPCRCRSTPGRSRPCPRS